MTTRIRPWLAALWVALHLWGLAAPIVGGWRWYYLAVAVLELAGVIAARLGRGPWGMWSPHVWSWVHDPFTGKVRGWLGFAVHAWVMYFAGAFMAVKPWTGSGADVLFALGFALWLEAHFLHYRRATEKPHG